MFCSISTTARTNTRHGRDGDPDLWLERPRRNRDETDQVHVVDLHEASANRPELFHRTIRSDTSHASEVPINLTGNLVSKLATWYRDTSPSPIQHIDLTRLAIVRVSWEQQPTRSNSRSSLNHWVIPSPEASVVLPECIPEIDSRIILGVENGRFQPFESQLFGPVAIIPLRNPDPVRREVSDQRERWSRQRYGDNWDWDTRGTDKRWALPVHSPASRIAVPCDGVSWYCNGARINGRNAGDC